MAIPAGPIPWKAPVAIGHWDNIEGRFVPVVAGINLMTSISKYKDKGDIVSSYKDICISINWNGEQIYLKKFDIVRLVLELDGLSQSETMSRRKDHM